MPRVKQQERNFKRPRRSLGEDDEQPNKRSHIDLTLWNPQMDCLHSHTLISLLFPYLTIVPILYLSLCSKPLHHIINNLLQFLSQNQYQTWKQIKNANLNTTNFGNFSRTGHLVHSSMINSKPCFNKIVTSFPPGLIGQMYFYHQFAFIGSTSDHHSIIFCIDIEMDKLIWKCELATTKYNMELNIPTNSVIVSYLYKESVLISVLNTNTGHIIKTSSFPSNTHTVHLCPPDVVVVCPVVDSVQKSPKKNEKDICIAYIDRNNGALHILSHSDLSHMATLNAFHPKTCTHLSDEDDDLEEDLVDDIHYSEPVDYLSWKYRQVGNVAVTTWEEKIYIVWGWNLVLNVAELLWNVTSTSEVPEKGVTLRHIGVFPVQLEVCWTNDPKELQSSFSCSSQYIALHRDRIILCFDTKGWKSASSFINIIDIHTGEILWKLTGALIWYMSPPTIFNNILYIVGGDGDITALCLDTFSNLWHNGYSHYADDDHNAKGMIIVSPHGHLFCGFSYSCNDHVWCIDLETGREYWKLVSEHHGNLDQNFFIPNHCQFVHNNKLFFQNESEELIIFAPK